MIHAGLENLNHLLLMVVSDQLQNCSSNRSGFLFLGLYLLNDNLVCVYVNTCGCLPERLIDFF